MKSLWEQMRSPRGGAFFAGLLSLLVLLPAWFFINHWYQEDLVRQERAKAAEQISAHANALAAAVQERIALLQGLYAFTRTEWPDQAFDRPFEIYSSGVYFNSTGVRTLMIAPEGIARYILPVFDASVLSGYDIVNDPDPGIRNDIQRAIRTRGITLSEPGELKQGGFGLTAWQAVYRGSELWGLVSIAVDLNTIFNEAGLNDLGADYDMALRDSQGHTFFGPGSVWQGEPVVQTIGLPENAWELGGVPREGWAAAIATQVNIFRIGSLMIVGLIVALVMMGVNRQGRLAQAVALRTREITRARQELEQRVEERTHELSTLLDVSRSMGSTLDLNPLLQLVLKEIKPVLDYYKAFIFRMDEAGKLALASTAGEIPIEVGTEKAWTSEELQSRVIATLQPVIAWDWVADGRGDKLCWMGVPLVIKDRATGMLVFVHQDPHAYQQEDAPLAMTFAQQVAVAIENARLYEQAGRVAVLEERQRLARDLHDSVSQVLYSIGLGAKTARAALDRDPAQIPEALDYVNRLAEAGQVEMRALIFELRPESLRTDGLVAALEKQVAVLRARHQMKVDTHFCPEPDVPLEVKEVLYRVSQEAMHNIVKHARATEVSVAMNCSDQQIFMEVCDNGIGFDPTVDYPGHLGLHSMRERLSQCHGEVQVSSAPGTGTVIRATIPLIR